MPIVVPTSVHKPVAERSCSTRVLIRGGVARSVMTRVLLVTLWCAKASTAAARSRDYSSADMSQYEGVEYDTQTRHEYDYHDDPDDYMYKEESGTFSGKTIALEETIEVGDTDSWSHRSKKKKCSVVDDHHDGFDPPADFPRTTYFCTRHRTSHKSRKSIGRDRHSDKDVQEYMNRPERGNQNGNENINVKSNYDVGKRKIWRKQRDKLDLSTLGIPDESFGTEDNGHSDRDDFGSSHSEVEEIRSDIDPWVLMKGGMAKPLEQGPNANQKSDLRFSSEFPLRLSPNDPEEEELSRPTKKWRVIGKIEEGDDDYSNEYYDMKRLMSKNQLPSLPSRRTTVREEVSPDSLPNDPFIPGPSRLLQKTLSKRRFFTETPLTTPPANETAVTTKLITATAKVNDTALSLAVEMSGLSFLKPKGGSPLKSLGLLQGTSLPTVATVDSTERPERGKQLMRVKLVACARNREVTDMACEYVDMSVLDTNAADKTATTASTVVVFITGIVFLR